MKKALLFSSIIAGTTIAGSAYAGASNSLDGLFYKPDAGDIVSRTTVSSSQKEYTSGSTNTEVDTTTVSETISYGVSRRLSVNVGLSYADAETEGSTTTEASGLTNPSFEIEYRTANQKQDGFFSDITLGYAPDVFDAENASTSDDGTVAQGGNVYTAGISYGKQKRKITYRVDLDTTYEEDVEYKDNSTSTTKSEDARTNFALGFAAQYRLNDVVSLDGSITKTVLGSNSTSGSNDNEGGNSLAFGVGANFTVNPDLVATVAYTHSDIDDSQVDGNSLSDADENTLSVSLAYRF